MNLLADESVDRPIVDRLRQQGHKERERGQSKRSGFFAHLSS